VREAAEDERVSPRATDALVSHYEDAQLEALKLAFLVAALLVLASLWSTRRLPAERLTA